MQPWNRTVLYWDIRGGTSGVETTLPVMDNKGEVVEGQTQKISSIRAVSLPGKVNARIEIGIHPSVNLVSHIGEHHILSRFTDLLGSNRIATVYRGKWGEGAWPPLIFDFTIHDGMYFYDAAIKIVDTILKRSGVQDENNYILGHFTLKQDTFVRFENGWISLVRSIRMQHKLPMECVGDDREIPLVELRDLS